MSRIVGYAWIADWETIGVIVTRDEITGALKGRIRVVPGDDAAHDLQLVHEWGVKLPLRAAMLLVQEMGVWLEEIPDVWRDDFQRILEPV